MVTNSLFLHFESLHNQLNFVLKLFKVNIEEFKSINRQILVLVQSPDFQTLKVTIKTFKLSMN